jgi:hypothetical protein
MFTLSDKDEGTSESNKIALLSALLACSLAPAPVHMIVFHFHARNSNPLVTRRQRFPVAFQISAAVLST